MGVVKLAVGCAVAALLAGHQLSTLDPARRAVLWSAARSFMRPDAPKLVTAETQPAPPVVPVTAPAMGGEETVSPDRLGQFQTGIEIEGRRLSALVDTGASFVALSSDDADRLGIRPMPADFKYAVDTANGRAYAARVQLASVRLGGIEVRDVTAFVGARGQLGHTLLGMSFLSRLSSVRMERGRLLLVR